MFAFVSDTELSCISEEGGGAEEGGGGGAEEGGGGGAEPVGWDTWSDGAEPSDGGE
jgi:hypothetical protein